MLRYYLMRDMVVGLDANFSETALVRRNNSDLANDLGNLHRRAVTLVARHFDNKVPDPGDLRDSELELVREAEILKKRVPVLVRELALHSAIEVTIAFIRRLNKFITETEPFRTVKTDPPAAARTLYVVLEGVRHAATLLAPIMPVKMAELIAALGTEPVERLDDLAWGGLKPGTTFAVTDGLFPRRDLPAEVALAAADGAAPEAPKAGASDKGGGGKGSRAERADKPAKDDKGAGTPGVVTFDDFMKVELVAATVLSAEVVAGSDKLLRLEVESGQREAPGRQRHRQALRAPATSSVARWWSSRTWRRRRCSSSSRAATILAADTPEGGLALIQPSSGVAPGTRVG